MANLKYNPYPPKVLPPAKYSVGTKFKHLDTEEIFKLVEVRQDTYILQGRKDQRGESLMTLEYDYEVING